MAQIGHREPDSSGEQGNIIGDPNHHDPAAREHLFTDMLREVAAASIAARTIDAPIRRTMELIAANGPFDLAHAIVERAELGGPRGATHLWHPPGETRFRSFRAASMALELSPDPRDGLIGKPLADAEPEWQEQLQVPEEASYDTRWQAAAECGLRSGFAAPILQDGRVCGVVEWLSTRSLPPDERLMAVVGSVGHLLGLALQRVTLERVVSDTLLFQQRRVGRELHDGLCQDLVGLGMQARRLQTLRAKGNHDEADLLLKQITSSLDEATDKARAMSRGLSPIEIDASGLIEAIRQLANNVAARFDLNCTVEVPEDLAFRKDAAAVNLYYIVSEAVHNAARHSGASGIGIEIEEQPDGVVARVRDDGSGLPASRNEASGMGLRVMKHRAAILNATLSIDSGPEQGTTVTCRLPREEL